MDDGEEERWMIKGEVKDEVVLEEAMEVDDGEKRRWMHD